MLKAFRSQLLELGVQIRWEARVDRLLTDAPLGQMARVSGVLLSSGESILADATVLAAGHSARELYSELLRCGATLASKDFAVRRKCSALCTLRRVRCVQVSKVRIVR